MNVRHVRQEHRYGCGVACLAMLMGCTYAEALERTTAIYPDAPERVREGGTGAWMHDVVLAIHGFAVARTWHQAPKEPRGAVNLAEVFLPAGAHCVVVLEHGAVLDPAKGPEPRRWKDYPDRNSIAAVVPVRAAAA